MTSSRRTPSRVVRTLAFVCGAVALAACGDQGGSGPLALAKPSAPATPSDALIAFDCTASVRGGTVTCQLPAHDGSANAQIVGGQNSLVKLTSSNVSYNSGTEIYQFDVTVQNLMNEALGSPDGVTPDSGGIKLFFHTGPTTTSGSGIVTVANADGVESFTASNQPFFRYSGVLPKNAVSGAKTWQLNVPSTVNSFAFKIYVSSSIQALLVINELMANPANYNSNPDAGGEWVELYNAGTLPVALNGLVFADSAASGRRPYNVFNTTDKIQPGGYYVIGGSKNTSTAAGANGGVPVDYAYGSGMSFANSLDAFKISRVYGTDTVTLDRTQYASAAISAQDGVARELKNPALDNSNMDGSNWASALPTAVYGPGGRGTPKAQNSTFTP